MCSTTCEQLRRDCDIVVLRELMGGRIRVECVVIFSMYCGCLNANCVVVVSIIHECKNRLPLPGECSK